ncbi:MAG: class I SAM-dependent methyltransferase [Pseudonocardiaceae bacterium]
MSSNKAGSGEERTWTWDPSLYTGSAAHYVVGRVDYPADLIDALVAALGIDDFGRLLDVGCGPGSLTLLLAPHFAEAIGIDADIDMLAEAARLAEEKRIHNVSWRHMRGEDLPADLSPVQVVTFAQSFHWMDRSRVAAAVRGLLVPGGALVHVHATTHQVLTPTPNSRTRSHPGRPSPGSCSATSVQSAAPDRACCRPEHPATRTRSTTPRASPDRNDSRCRGGWSRARLIR